MPQVKIKELQAGDVFSGFLLISNVNFATTRKQSQYIAIEFMDPSGTMPSKLWDTPHASFNHAPGEIVKLDAMVEEFNGALQFRCTSIVALDQDHPANNPSYYLKGAPVERQKMEEEIGQVIDEIKSTNERYGKIIDKVLNMDSTRINQNNFYTQPAAMHVHHNFLGGLAFHTLRMLRHGIQVAETYPFLNKELLLTAILLHDTGKLLELTGYLGTDYTVQGNLLGHIILLDGWLVKICSELGYDSEMDEDIVLLRHTLLSHHGKLEYGSPVTGKIPEAEAIHSIDMLDAHLTIFEMKLNDLEPGQISDRLFGLESNNIYKAVGQGHNLL